jgi:hypothetical protein
MLFIGFVKVVRLRVCGRRLVIKLIYQAVVDFKCSDELAKCQADPARLDRRLFGYLMLSCEQRQGTSDEPSKTPVSDLRVSTQIDVTSMSNGRTYPA